MGDDSVVDVCAEPLADVEIWIPLTVRPTAWVALPRVFVAVFVTPPTVLVVEFTTPPTVFVTPPSKPPPPPVPPSKPPPEPPDERAEVVLDPEISELRSSPTFAAALRFVIETIFATIATDRSRPWRRSKTSPRLDPAAFLPFCRTYVTRPIN